MNDRFGTFNLLTNRISRSIYRIKNKEIAAFNLKSPHVSCLYHLYKTDGLTATELCQKCEEDKAAVSRSLDFLEKNEYVVCKTAQSKRYKSPFFLTDKGRQVGKEIIDKIDKILDAVDAGPTEEERILFYRYLSIISERLENIADNL
jgi:DNA-binding MarR family transcriptional regulator